MTCDTDKAVPMEDYQGREWLTIRRWHSPVDEYWRLNAEVRMSRIDLQCRFCVVMDRRVIWSAPAVHPSAWSWSWQEEAIAVAKFIRKAVAAVNGQAAALSAAGQAWAEKHEAIVEYMTCEELPGGGARVTSMLCVFWEAGLYKVALQDRQEGLSLWASAQSIPEALEALEGRLRAGDGDWRPMRGQRPAGGRKR